jgi:hypothetical protein
VDVPYALRRQLVLSFLFAPTYHDGWSTGPDAAELRAWITDEIEQGDRVAE